MQLFDCCPNVCLRFYSDMKMENILMKRDGHCILTDFGLSASLKKGARVHSFSGTAIYLGTYRDAAMRRVRTLLLETSLLVVHLISDSNVSRFWLRQLPRSCSIKERVMASVWIGGASACCFTC